MTSIIKCVKIAVALHITIKAEDADYIKLLWSR